jgi:hypothetical protein
MLQQPNPRLYRLTCPAGAFFLSFGLCEPRGSVLLAMGGRFLRAARFSFLRSCLSWIFVVSMSAVSFSYTSEVGAALVAARFVLQCCPLFPTETVVEQSCLQSPVAPGHEDVQSYSLQRGIFFHHLFPPVARKADGQSCVITLAIALNHRAQPVFRVTNLRPQLPAAFLGGW